MQLLDCSRLVKGQQIFRRLSVYHARTVYYVIKRYKDTGGTSDRPRSGRPRSANTSRIRNIIRLRLKRNPTVKLRNLAKHIKVARESVRRIVKNNLGLYPYKLQKHHFLR